MRVGVFCVFLFEMFGLTWVRWLLLVWYSCRLILVLLLFGWLFAVDCVSVLWVVLPMVFVWLLVWLVDDVYFNSVEHRTGYS